jgi:hypothetical protein
MKAAVRSSARRASHDVAAPGMVRIEGEDSGCSALIGLITGPFGPQLTLLSSLGRELTDGYFIRTVRARKRGTG